MMELVFWVSLALVAYAYAGFPLLLGIRALLLPRPWREADATPRASLVVCAHNEAASIGAKLENVLALDWPPERLEILVASDGSSDATESIVRSFAPRGVRLLPLPRRGKIPTLNAAVAETSGEILIFSDANSMYEPGALRALARPFADPEVGGVAGDQRYLGRRGRDGTDGERAYWDLDRQLKRWESLAGSVTSATGAIYAIRRELFRSVVPGVTDDFFVSTNVIRAGRRLVFAPDALAFEPVAASSSAEFQRKVRVATRGLRGVWVMRALLDPFRHGFYALQLFSHKVLRRLVGLPLLALLCATPFLWNEGWIYRAALAAQLAVYGAAAAARLVPWLGRSRAFGMPLYFCLVNLAALRAAWNVLTGRRIDVWEPERSGAPADASPRTAEAAP
jgi:cellulose synthase/poly-beta-1,6-N-acetylglucosamine synthase-like glycosyltransferase